MDYVSLPDNDEPSLVFWYSVDKNHPTSEKFIRALYELIHLYYPNVDIVDMYNESENEKINYRQLCVRRK